MSAVKNDEAEDIVRVTGRIEVGRILEERERAPKGDGFHHEPDAVEGSTLPPHARRQVRSLTPNRTSRKPFKFSLEKTAKHLFLENDGLTQQYGILGEPGSGKTHLLLHLLRQIIGHRAGDGEDCDRERQFGGIILDPKSALIDGVRRAFAAADRADDLVVINSRELARTGPINVIDCMLGPRDLAKAIVLAAQSSGIGGTEPFWFQQMANTFAAILGLLQFTEPAVAPTLERLATMALGQQTTASKKIEPALNTLVRDAELLLSNGHPGDEAPGCHDARIWLETLRRHLGADPKNLTTVEQFMEQALSLFRYSASRCYSAQSPSANVHVSLYDQIIDDGKVLLVSPGPGELELSSILPTLVKLIFQRTVLSRFDRYRNFELHNRVRPVLFLADEYHMVATQVQGERVGDGEYFSMARQAGGLCLVATQTVRQLESSGLGERWHAVFGTLAAVIGMKVRDAATIEYLRERAGDTDVLDTTQGYTSERGRVTINENANRTGTASIPADVLRLFVKGDAVVIGTTAGQDQPAAVTYVRVPKAGPGA